MIYKVSERPVIIVIGQQGENDAENIQVDYSEWIEKYGSGIITAEYQRPDMTYPYPVTLTMADGIATWTVSETDVTWEDSGNGNCGKMTGFVQLVYKVGEIVKKTVIWPVQVNKSLGTSGPVPDPVQSWIDQMVELGAVVAENAAKAEQAAADAESYAEAAQSSANDADAAAEAAAASAEAAATAKNAAETAQAAAEAAQTAAEQAKTEAETAKSGAEAAQAAAEAAQAAAEAAQAAAEAAAEAAESAQNAAESARDAAQAAQTAAEAARDAAQQYAEEAAEAAVNALIPFMPVDSASGAIASFPDGANDIPVISLTAEIEPVQDLHGYDSPWPAGGGKNILPLTQNGSDAIGLTVTYDEDEEAYVINGTCTSQGNMTLATYSSIAWTEGDTYTLSFSKVSGSITIAEGTGITFALALFSSDYSQYFRGSTNETDITSSLNVSRTAFSGTNARLLLQCWRVGTVFNNLKVRVQLEKGSSATSWTPYSNECPISGHTGVTVERTGGNIWDEEWESGQYNGNVNTGNITKAADNTRIRSKNDIPVKENTTYYVFAPQPLFAYFLDKDKNWMNRVGSNGTTLAKNASFTTPEGCAYIKFFTVNTAAYDKNISINYPSTDHDYHAYQGESIPISWESEAGTVYGCTVDVVTGKLRVDRAMVDMGTLSGASGWQYITNDGDPYFRVYLDNKKPGLGMLCSDYQVNSTTGTRNLLNKRIGASVADSRVYVRDNAYTTLESFLTAMNGVQLVYELAEPIEYTLTPQEVKTYLGQNNIWNDCGNTEVTYRADIQKYIEKKVSA